MPPKQSSDIAPVVRYDEQLDSYVLGFEHDGAFHGISSRDGAGVRALAENVKENEEAAKQSKS